MNLKVPVAAAAAAMSSTQTPTPSATTVICGLNAALQKRFILSPTDRLIPGNVHRAQEIQTGLGGKGQDVAVTLSCLEYNRAVSTSDDDTSQQQQQQPSLMQVAQFIGQDAAGDAVFDIMRQQVDTPTSSCLTGATVRCQAAMRTCTSIVAHDSTTELVEPSGVVSKPEIEELLQQLKELADDGVDSLVIMGSMPPGCPEDLYAQIYESLQVSDNDSASGDAPFLCLIDSVIGLKPLLTSIAEASTTTDKRTILKINASELCRLVGVTKTASESGGVATTELVDAIQAFYQQYPPTALTALAITDGPHPAYLATWESNDDKKKVQLYQLPVPTLNTQEQTIYPIGAGDSVAAGTLAAWKSLVGASSSSSCRLPESLLQLLEPDATADMAPDTQVMLTSLAFGIACGTASCLQEENSVLKQEDVVQFYKASGPAAFVSSHDI